MKGKTKTIIAKTACILIVFAGWALISAAMKSHPSGELLIYPLGVLAGVIGHRISIS